MKRAIILVYQFNKLATHKVFFLAAIVLIGLLLYKDVYSERTLVANIEPYPDTLHYIVPARSLIAGGPFSLVREYGSSGLSVTPLYSLFLIPFYLLNYDPRTYYFLNFFLAISSFIIFSKIAGGITKNKWIYGFSLLVYSTSYFIYWYPQWAMAENLLLTLFLLGIYLIQSNISRNKIILAALICASFFATKLSHAPTSFVFGAIYLHKIYKEGKGQVRFKNILIYVFSSLVLWISILAYADQKLNFHIFSSSSTVAKTIATSSASSSPWYSKEYIPLNLPKYINAFSGGSERFLWDYTPMYAKWIAFLGLTGIFAAVFVDKKRKLSFSMLIILGAQTLFISSFYAFDLRYLYFVIPIVILGLVYFLDMVENIIGEKKRIFLTATVLILAAFYLYGNILRVKDQIVLNIRYAEVPWQYKAVLNLNNFFDKKVEKNRRPFVISAQPPYYVDFFSNGNYRLLPLSNQQDFRSNREKVWGPGDYSDFTKLYESKLKEGNELYFSSYGLGIEGYLHSEFTKLQKNFKVTLLTSNCFDLCNIYRVELKD